MKKKTIKSNKEFMTLRLKKYKKISKIIKVVLSHIKYNEQSLTILRKEKSQIHATRNEG